MDRRRFFKTSALLGAALATRTAQAQDDPHSHERSGEHLDNEGQLKPEPVEVAPVTRREPPGTLDTPHRRVVTPNNFTLPWREVDGVKVFHLTAESVPDHEFAPGLVCEVWGYNGHSPGPTIELVQGDRVRIYVTNRLPEATSVHWHGLILPSGMDGVGGLSHPHIKPGETFRYEFTFQDVGTFMYHPHIDEMTQIGLGMTGMIVVHPRDAGTRPLVDRDYCIMLHEWFVPIGARRPDPRTMSDFNILTMNHRAFPGTEPLVAQTGERVRIRFGNLSPMTNHPIHLHGHNFPIVATDGGLVPPSAQQRETTVHVPVGSTRDIEFVANAGDWAMHCHLTHHVMNQMGHEGPNMVGADVSGLDPVVREQVPGYMTMGTDGMAHMAEMKFAAPDNSIPMLATKGPHGAIDMGGMMTILKVRNQLDDVTEPGWYDPPPGTMARPATADELAADGIDV